MEPGLGRSAPHVSSSEHIRPRLIETPEQPIVGGKLVKGLCCRTDMTITIGQAAWFRAVTSSYDVAEYIKCSDMK